MRTRKAAVQGRVGSRSAAVKAAARCRPGRALEPGWGCGSAASQPSVALACVRTERLPAAGNAFAAAAGFVALLCGRTKRPPARIAPHRGRGSGRGACVRLPALGAEGCSGYNDDRVAGRVLVVRAGALGDTLMVTPLIRRLRETAPHREVDVLCSAGGASLLRTNPHVSAIHVLRLRNMPYFCSLEKRRLVRTLRERGYEFAALLESAKRYRVLLEKAAIPDIRSFRETPFDPAQHSIVNNLRVAGFTDCEGSDLDMDLPVSDEALMWAAGTLAELPRPRIGLHAGYGPARRKKGQADRLRGWHTGSCIEVAGELVRRGASIVLTGSKGDLGVCNEIARTLPRGRVIVCASQTSVEQLGGVIKTLDLLVSVDSGPAHMAAAIGTPLVVLWGPGILAQTRPLSSATPIRILRVDVPCAPCYGTPQMRRCIRNVCMERILPSAVVSAALETLDCAKEKFL